MWDQDEDNGEGLAVHFMPLLSVQLLVPWLVVVAWIFLLFASLSLLFLSLALSSLFSALSSSFLSCADINFGFFLE